MFTHKGIVRLLLVSALALGTVIAGAPPGRWANAHYLPTAAPSPAFCTNDDWWTPTSLTNVPDARSTHTAVWTGSEMIVWGGVGSSGYLNTGARYDPATDTWTAISLVNAPEARAEHQAIWTGSEMIVWGGHNARELNSGGRYNPASDTWMPVSTINAPVGRRTHTIIWTGSEMIVWGGHVGYRGDGLSTGGRYNPATDIWTATSVNNVPSGREGHTAVWTGSEMIVWGGNVSANVTDTGGRYNPASDTWTATSRVNDPYGRYHHSAIWSGNDMIVWGGFGYNSQGQSYLDTGGRYNPASDTWTTTSTNLAPSLRGHHPAIWTGSEMVIWGGYPTTNTGGRYSPATNSWRVMDSAAAPSERNEHTVVWTGNEVIVWGGISSSSRLNTGGRYCIPASSCAYALTPTSHYFLASGGSGSINLAAGNACPWTATSNDNWILVTSAASGSGSAPISFAVRENFDSSARSGQITVAEQHFTVMQEGRGGDCSYTIAPTFATIAAAGGSGTISVTAAAGCGWEAVSRTGWLTITANADGMGSGVVSYVAAANQSGAARKGKISIAGQTFAIKQKAN
ncbi:MAG: BACON domain-containing protein [Blastocatellia bacterium]